jgi:hypothetical protein
VSAKEEPTATPEGEGWAAGRRRWFHVNPGTTELVDAQPIGLPKLALRESSPFRPNVPIEPWSGRETRFGPRMTVALRTITGKSGKDGRTRPTGQWPDRIGVGE